MRTLAYKIIFINAFLRKGRSARGWRKMGSRKKIRERKGGRERKEKTERKQKTESDEMIVLNNPSAKESVQFSRSVMSDSL